MSDELTKRIVDFLDAHHVMSLATLSREGPHAANVFYARDGLALLWVSDPRSRHSMHIDVDPRISATISPDYCDFLEIRGLQIVGRARCAATDLEQARARDCLQTRYPFLQMLADGPQELRDAYGGVRFYRLEPSQIVLIDNSRGFGHKDTLEVSQAEAQSDSD